MNFKQIFNNLVASTEIKAHDEATRSGDTYQRILSRALTTQSIKLLIAYAVGAFAFIGALSWWLL